MSQEILIEVSQSTTGGCGNPFCGFSAAICGAQIDVNYYHHEADKPLTTWEQLEILEAATIAMRERVANEGARRLLNDLEGGGGSE